MSIDAIIPISLFTILIALGIAAYFVQRKKLADLWTELSKRFRATAPANPFDGLLLRTGSVSIRVTTKASQNLGGIDKMSFTTGLKTAKPFFVMFLPRNADSERVAKTLTSGLTAKLAASQQGKAFRVEKANDQAFDQAFVIVSDGITPMERLRPAFAYMRNTQLIYTIGSLSPTSVAGEQVLAVTIASTALDFDPNVAQDRVKVLANLAEALTHHKFGHLAEPPVAVVGP